MSIWDVSVHLVEPGAYKTGLISAIATETKSQFDKLSPEMKVEYGQEYLQGGSNILQNYS